jgi:hypothetical protein
MLIHGRGESWLLPLVVKNKTKEDACRVISVDLMLKVRPTSTQNKEAG